jgi:hypothetical protein
MGFETAPTRGVTVHYGPRATNSKFGGLLDSDGVVKTQVITFNYDDLPAYGSGNLNQSIPAYAKIVSSRFEVLTAFTSTSTTTDLDVGLYQNGGTVIDLDGLHTAAQLTQTAIGTRGNFYLGAGALVGASIGAAAGEVVVTPTVADLTAGKGRIIIDYILEGV